MKSIADFISRFGSNFRLNENLITEKENRWFLLNDRLKSLTTKDFFYAGTYLGKIKKGEFFPSFPLLGIIAEGKSNKVIVDRKTEWLFICGRDVFKRGITTAVGSKKKGAYTLVLNQHGECLGFGKLTADLDEAQRDVIVKNISDIGDFLRRERAK